jgi:hypothetical protein
MFGKTIVKIGPQPIQWIYNAHGIEQGTLGEMVVQLFDQLGSCNYKPTKTIEKRKTTNKNTHESKQSRCTHKPTKRNKKRKLQHILKENKAPN